jgi:hypothetical protein
MSDKKKGVRPPKKKSKHQRRLLRQGVRKRSAAKKTEKERITAEKERITAVKAKQEQWKAEKKRYAAKKKQEMERLRRILGLSLGEWPTPELKKWHDGRHSGPYVDVYFKEWFDKLGRVAYKAASIARLLELGKPIWSERTKGEIKSLEIDSLRKFLNPCHPYRDR